MSQLILTAHTGIHDAGAALFEDYNLLAAVQLERLTRLSEIIMLRSTASIALLSFDPVRSA
jgi:predicted NodU family carbamoyl transferase